MYIPLTLIILVVALYFYWRWREFSRKADREALEAEERNKLPK